MQSIQLAYSTFGLTKLSFLEAIHQVAQVGYSAVELSFHRRQFNPFMVSGDELLYIADRLAGLDVRPACVATASLFFNPLRPHNPSLMATDLAGRKRRIALIKQGIRVARAVGSPLVTFGSGFVRPEHLGAHAANPYELLVDSIHECLQAIRDDEDITLLIEPEPGMRIETMQQGLDLVADVNSDKFKLHVDLCHAYCSEPNYIKALTQAAPQTRYLHISDAQQGYNLKIVEDHPALDTDLSFASQLVYFPDTAGFLLVDAQHRFYFSDEPPTASRRQRIETIFSNAGIRGDFKWQDYGQLYAGTTEFDDEIFTYLISIPHLSFDVLERAAPIVAWLRGVSGTVRIHQRVANTLTGIVHFHEIPGRGTLDFSRSFKALAENGFNGAGAIELYHDVNNWQQALSESYGQLINRPYVY